MTIIYSGLFALFGVYFLIFSTSKKNYQRLVENNDKKYADRNTKVLKIAGFLLLVFSLILMISTFI
jgi:isoprenylcysteine carboxyl methyltransferase (ICMT) family protein YpbQ